MSISQLENYSPIGWQNYASGGTKLNATNLNHGDSAIDANRDKINEVVTAVNTANSYIEATETLTGNPVAITTAVAENLSGCTVGIVAQQSGTPSPDSPVAITGMSSVTISNAESGVDYTFNIGSTCYGGTLNTKTGVLTVTHVSVDMGDLTWTASQTYVSGKYRMRSTDLVSVIDKPSDNSVVVDMKCGAYQTISGNNVYLANVGIGVVSAGYIDVYDETYNTSSSASAFKTAMDGVQLVYKLATPTTTTLTAQEIALIVGENTLSTDASTMTASYSVSLSDILRRLKALES